VKDPLSGQIHFGIMAGIREEDEAAFVAVNWDTADTGPVQLVLDPAVAARLGRSLLTAVAHLEAQGHKVDEAKVRSSFPGAAEA